MYLIAATIQELFNNPKAKFKRGFKNMIITINYNDLLGNPLSEKELIQEMEKARQYIGIYRFHKQGLTQAKLFLEEYIKIIEIAETTVSKRYQLLKYVISRMFEDSDLILDKQELKPFIYRFEKEKGKTVLKIDYDVNKYELEKNIKKQEQIEEDKNKLLKLIRGDNSKI